MGCCRGHMRRSGHEALHAKLSMYCITTFWAPLSSTHSLTILSSSSVQGPLWRPGRRTLFHLSVAFEGHGDLASRIVPFSHPNWIVLYTYRDTTQGFCLCNHERHKRSDTLVLRCVNIIVNATYLILFFQPTNSVSLQAILYIYSDVCEIHLHQMSIYN